jgi:hypothetical protein
METKWIEKLKELRITPFVVSNDFYDYEEDNFNLQILRDYLFKIGRSDIENFDDYLKFADCEFRRIFPPEINGGEHMYLQFKDKTVLKADGYYNSYDGEDYSGSEWFEVKKKRKTITYYE